VSLIFVALTAVAATWVPKWRFPSRRTRRILCSDVRYIARTEIFVHADRDELHISISFTCLFVCTLYTLRNTGEHELCYCRARVAFNRKFDNKNRTVI